MCPNWILPFRFFDMNLLTAAPVADDRVATAFWFDNYKVTKWIVIPRSSCDVNSLHSTARAAQNRAEISHLYREDSHIVPSA